MPRRIRYHERFRRDLATRVRWLAANRPAAEREHLRAALDAFMKRAAAHPGIGREIERRGTRSYRVSPISGRLPYLVWYVYDLADRRGPVSLLMILHEAQDRERFDEGDWD